MSIRPSLLEVVKMFHQNNRFLSANLTSTPVKAIIEAIIKELVDVLEEVEIQGTEKSIRMKNISCYFKIIFGFCGQMLFISLFQNPQITKEVDMENLPITSNFLLDLILKSKFLLRLALKPFTECYQWLEVVSFN